MTTFTINHAQFETRIEEVEVEPVSVTVTLSAEDYMNLRTLVMRDLFDNHLGSGMGPLSGGLFYRTNAEQMGDYRCNREAGEDITEEPI